MKNSKIIVIITTIIIIAVCVIGISIFSNQNEKEEEKEIFKFLYKDKNIFYYIDKQEKIYKYEGYESIGDFHNGLAVFSKKIDNKKVYGVMDKDEKEIIKSGNYASIEQIENTENYIVQNKSLYGVIDKREKIILPIEYKGIKTLSSDFGDLIYVVQTSESKYYYLATNGKIITEADNFVVFEYSQYPKINEKYDGIIGINNQCYNSRTGEKIFNESEEIYFEYNILFEKNKAISIYDKNLKLKEKIETPNTNSVSIHKLNTGYIVLIEYISTEARAKYRIYDQDLNLQKEIECPNTGEVSVEEMDKQYFYIEEESAFGAKEKRYRIIIYDKNLKEYTRTREGLNNARYWINSKGEILFAINDKETKNIRIYNAKEENIANISMKNYTTWEIRLNHILLERPGYYDYYDVYNESGKLVAEKVNWIWDIDSENVSFKDKFVKVERSGKEYSVLLQDGTELKEKGGRWRICGENLISFNSTNKQMKIYNLEGKLKNEIIDVEEIEICADTYIVLKNSNKYRIYDCKKEKIVFEFDIKIFDYKYSEKGINYIVLEDGFYNFEGKKLVEKNK